LASLEHGRIPTPRTVAAREVPLVDRTEEMEVLKEAVYSAVHGEGGLVFVHGEAGIGKTRLLREVGAYAKSRGVKVLHGRCPALFRMDGVPPYVIWKEVIKDYLETCTPEQLYRVVGYYPAEVAKLVLELRQKLGTIPESFPISPEQEQNRLFEAVSQFITNISREAPLLVVLDDLQWTDTSSLLLLHYLARDVQKRPMLLLGAYRSTDLDAGHPLTSVLAELNRERLTQSVSLKRMSLSDTSEMIKQMLEQDDVPEEFCRIVYEKTRGNPFFAEEVIKSLEEEEVIYREKKWKIKEVSRIQFPETVKSVVKARISRLNDECQNVLTMASLVGNDFTLEALQGVFELDEDKLRKIVDELLKTGLLKHRAIHGEDVCSFADIIVRDVMYEEVGTFERKKLHGNAGAALEKVYARKIDEHFGELAYHFLEAGDKDKALDYFLKAGEKAQKIYANSEAASYYKSSFRLLEEKEEEPRKRAKVLERLGDVTRAGDEYDAGVNFWGQALLLWEQLGEKEKVAELHRRMSFVLWIHMGETGKAREHQQMALGILEKEPESVELAQLYAHISQFSWVMEGNMEKARSYAEKALELANKMNASEVIAEAYNTLALVCYSFGERRRAIEFLERALKIALCNSDMQSAMRTYENLGNILTGEEMETSLEYYEKGFELAKKVGRTDWIPWLGSRLAGMHIGSGNTNKALQLAEQSVTLARKTYIPGNLKASLITLGYVYMVTGEWNKSEQLFMEALDISGVQRHLGALGYNRLGDFFLYAKEEPVKAKEFYEKAYREKAGAKFDLDGSAQTMSPYSEGLIASCIELGEIDKASSMLDDYQKYGLEVNATYLISAAHLLRARLLRAQKRWEESIEYFNKGLREWKALNYGRRNVYNFARLGLYEYARVYLERCQEGDKEKGRDLLNQALEIYQRLGAKKDIEKVEAKIAFIETGKAVTKLRPPDYVSTGHADLDKLLCGGISPNYAAVLTSPSCDERDVLIKSFLETGAKKGEVTFFVTIDPIAGKTLAEEFQSNFYLFLCNPEADAIIKSSPNVFTLKGVENLTEISIALTSTIRKLDPSKKGARRICIGLVSDVLLQHQAVETRRWLTALLTKLKSENFTTLAVMDPEMHPSQEVRAVLDLFNGEISIYKKKAQKGPGKFLKIQKMSGQKYIEDELPLKKEQL